jgi:iron complex transport system permease protein
LIKLIWIKLAVLVLLLSLLSMLIGPVSIVDARVNWQDDKLPELSTILWEIRAPRTLLGLMVGGALGMSGAAMQGLLRNPLAEPSLVGASSGAALGAVIALYSGLSSAFYLALPIAGFCGAALVSVMVIALAGLNAEITVIILAGSAGSALCAALISLVLNFSPNPHAGIEIVFWLMGSLADRSWDEVTLILPPMIMGSILLSFAGKGLLAMSLGEATAHSMGFSPTRLRALVLIGSCLLVGSAVSVAGSIGFIGLVAPHLMRASVQADPKQLLPVAALAGAALLLSADMGTRLLANQGPELKLGVLTALLGSPFFFALVLRMRYRG